MTGFVHKYNTINDKNSTKFKYPTGIHSCKHFINLIYFFIFVYISKIF
jgi:hypothetical protein